MLKSFFLNHKNDIKYQDVEFETIEYVHIDGKNEKHIRKHTYTVTGIGNKAVKYQKDHGEDEFVFYDNREFKKIARTIIKSFDNELWNEEIREAIDAQRQYCKEHKYPMFAPNDGFCFSCGKQIYTRINSEYAGKEHITGCPHCSRSYCD